MSLPQVKDIDQRTKSIVSGYIRTSNVQSVIPEHICHICALFYYLIPDKFIKYGNQVKLLSSDETTGRINDIARIKHSSDHSRFQYVHGNVNIIPNNNPNAIMEWTIQVLTFSFFSIGF